MEFIATEVRLLGIVDWVTQEKLDPFTGKPKFERAFLRPLYHASADGFEWEKIENAAAEFKNTGGVVWFNAPLDVEPETLWEFYCIETPTFDENDPHKAKYQVDRDRQFKRPDEVLLLPSSNRVGGYDEVRHRISDEGLLLEFSASSKVYLNVDDKTLLGPFSLIKREDGRCHVPAKALEQNVIIYSFSKRRMQEIKVNGITRFLIPPAVNLDISQGKLDWASDDVILKRALNWFRNQRSSYAESLGLFKTVITQAGQIVAEGNADPVLQQRLNRSRRIVAALEENHSLAQVLLQEIQSLPFVTKKIEDEVEIVKADTEKQIRDTLKNEENQIQKLRVEKTKLEEELSSLNQRCQDQQATLEQVSTTSKIQIEEALTDKLNELSTRPEQIMADLLIFRAAMKFQAQPSSNGSPPILNKPVSPSSLSLPHWKPVDDEAEILSDQKCLQKRLNSLYESRGFNKELAARIHSAFLSGQMPLLAGIDSFEALKLYASQVANGRILWLPITATTLDPSDLLGKWYPQTQSFIPNPNQLIDLLIHARSSDEIFIVVLDGVNRGPIDSYLMTFLSLYEDIWNDSINKRSLAIFNPLAGDVPPIYRPVASLTWPANVLLAGIWSEGALSSLTPAAFWEHVAFIPTIEELLENENGAGGEIKGAQVNFKDWIDWRSLPKEAVNADGITLSSLGVQLSGKRKRELNQFMNLMSQWNQDSTVLQQEIVRCCIIPQLVTSGQEQILDDLKRRNSEWAALPKAIENIQRCLR